VAVWGESSPDGRPRVYGRRLTGLTLSVAPQEVSLPDFEGAAGGPADAPDLTIEDDGSYAWVAWRQDFGGVSRALTRRLVGSLFEPAVAIDGGGPADAPRVDMSGRGVGSSAVGLGTRAVQGALLEQDVFGQSLRIDSIGSDSPPIPVATTSEREQTVIAWRATAGPNSGEVRARYRPEKAAFEPEQVVSIPDFGPAATDGLELARDRLGDFAVGFLQGLPSSRRIVVAVYDRPPGAPQGMTSTRPRKTIRPHLQWRPGAELWGAQTFKVLVDGQLEETTGRSTSTITNPLDDGAHTWQVIAVDRRGQETAGKPRTLRIDSTPPDVAVKIGGKRKAGKEIKLRATVQESGYGLRYTQIDWGDGSPRILGSNGVHRYRRGKYELAVKAVDKAGNVTRNVYSLRIKK
jgi:hypothetical protein